MIGNLFVVLYLLYCFKYTFKKAYKHTFFEFEVDENYAIAKVQIKYPCKSL